MLPALLFRFPLQPEVVAAALLRGIERWRFFISVGFDGWMLSTVTAGMAPAGSLLTATVQAGTRVKVLRIVLYPVHDCIPISPMYF